LHIKFKRLVNKKMSIDLFIVIHMFRDSCKYTLVFSFYKYFILPNSNTMLKIYFA